MAHIKNWSIIFWQMAMQTKLRSRRHVYMDVSGAANAFFMQD